MSFEAVLFDLDGTLLDTLDDLADAMSRALKALGHPPCTPRQCRRYVGDGMAIFARRALPEGHRDDATVAACCEIMVGEYAKRWAEHTRPYDGIGELLTALTNRGCNLAVLSNKPDHSTKLMVAELLPHWRFAPVLGAREGVARKPDPAGALEIAAALNLKPREFLYLGDTDTDMQTATAAGMHAIGALWGFRDAEELLANGAKALVSRPQDVLTLLS